MKIGAVHSMRTVLPVIMLLLAAVSHLFSQTPPPRIDSWISVVAGKNNPDLVRERAAGELGELRTYDTTAMNALIKCLSDENLYLVGRAARSLSQVGKKAVPYLMKAIQDTSENRRWGAAIALSKIGRDGSEAVPFLIEALKDRSDNVRWCSLIALGNIGEAASGYADRISGYLADSNEDIAWASVYALSKINPKRLSEPPDYDSVTKTIERLVPGLMKELHVPGVSVCLVKGGNVAWSKSFGVKDARTLEPVSHETMFEACSMSKPVFAYAVLRLAEEKKLDLDRPLAYYLDEDFISIAGYKHKITARMILCHTSGLPNWRKGEEETDGPLPIYFEPGTRFGYSGEGFYYLQRVVEKITGMPMDVYVRKTLFEPLGLKHMNYVWTREYRFDYCIRT